MRAARRSTRCVVLRERRADLSPHPLVDVARIVAEHPDAARHPHGPLAWWVASAREDTPVPVPDGVPEITWGRLRGAALEAAERRAETDDVRLAQRRTKHAARGRSPPPPAAARPPATEPLVTVVLAVRDDGPRLRAGRRHGPGTDVRRLGAGRRRRRLGRRHPRRAGRHRGVRAAGRAGDRAARRAPARARNAGARQGPRDATSRSPTPDHTWHPDFLRVMLGHLEAEGAAAGARRDARAAPRRRVVPRRRRRPRPPARPRPRRPRRARRPARPAGRRSAASTRRWAAPSRSTCCSSWPRTGADAAGAARAARPRRTTAPDDDPRWTATVLERHLVDWEAAQHRPREARRVSIVLHTDGRPRPHGALGDPDDVAARARAPTSSSSSSAPGCRGASSCPLAMLLATYPNARLLAPLARHRAGGRAPTSASRRPPARSSCSRARPPTRRATRSTALTHVLCRPRRGHRPAAGRRPAGAGRQRRRGVRPRPHRTPSRSSPGTR